MLINFNRKIYKKTAVSEAIKKFAPLADFELKTENNFFKVKVKNIEPALQADFQDEFGNYVLYLSNK